jgi:dihydrodipicolinate synthase/N-acetylneuraminate lyase
MSFKKRLTRRQVLRAAMAGASGAVATSLRSTQGSRVAGAANADGADPRIQGPFLILSTPFTESGEVDFDVLANEARFVDWCGCPGMIWPQSGDSVDLLTVEEKLQGMEVLADATRGLNSALCLGVNGNDTAETLVFAKHAEKLEPAAIISRPPDDGTSQDDIRTCWRQVISVVRRPMIMQTTGGVAYTGPVPSTEMMAELAKESPYFGYVKEEAGAVINRMCALLAARPPIRRVFGARGGYGWLHELNLGAEGLITERAVYADLLTRVWQLHKSGAPPRDVADAYSKFLLMANLSRTHPGELRGYQLYVWKKRGVFKNMISRHYGPHNSIPDSPRFSALNLNEAQIKEIDFRFEAIRPYLKPGSPDFLSPS